MALTAVRRCDCETGNGTARTRKYQVASVIAPDLPWLRALEGACEAKLRRRRDANAILEGVQVLRVQILTG
jgi:hypothetical protein